MILSIIFCTSIHNGFEKHGFGELYKCTTRSYFSLIILSVLAVGYFVCRTFIKEKNNSEINTASEREMKSTVVDKLQQEVAMIEVIRKYKELLDNDVISAADYVYIKSKLLSPVGQRGTHCQKKETLIIELLKEYQSLYTEEIITSAEFIAKKGELVQL